MEDLPAPIWIVLFILWLIFIPIWYVFFANNPQLAAKALSTTNLTNIQYTGARFYGCADDDFYQTGFKATTSNGKNITGVVCSGLIFKGSTIRYD